MVQLPATAAIEYVAAGWVSGAGGFLSGGAFVRWVFCPGALLPGGIFVWGAFIRGSFARGSFVRGGLMPVPPQVQCVYAPSRLSVPSIVA